MDIQVYEDIYNGLKEYNDGLDNNYGNVVLKVAQSTPTYPYTLIDEIRNTAREEYNTTFDKVSRIGYKVDIYAKTKGNVLKQTIARQLVKEMDYFLTRVVGLTQISWNISEQENDSSIYHIIITYTASLLENRRKII